MVFCEALKGLPKSKGWIFPDGTNCRTKQSSDFDDSHFCINGRCEKFTCSTNGTNYYKINPDYCPQSLVVEEHEATSTNSVQQENGRDYKSLKIIEKRSGLKDTGILNNATVPDNNKLDSQQNSHYIAASSVKAEIYDEWRQRAKNQPQYAEYKASVPIMNKWTIKSGCHFSCMENAKGLQLVESSPEQETNIQLCSPDLLPCDHIQTTFEYATKLCTKYRAKGKKKRITQFIGDICGIKKYYLF